MPPRRALVRFGALQLALVAAVGTGLWLAWPAWRLGQVTDKIRRLYPDVPQLSTADLTAWLVSQNSIKPVLLDVRTPAEFEVGHLIEAHPINPDSELADDDLPEDRGRAIVVTCSTGERSAAFARRLQRAGYTHIFALEGGIIRWANEGRPMTNDRELVTRVHPGDPETARLLKGARRAAVPAAP
jgi:rhodanese-related sulfurtransferase